MNQLPDSDRAVRVEEASIVRVNGQNCIVLPDGQGLSVHPLPTAPYLPSPPPIPLAPSFWDNPAQVRLVGLFGVTIVGMMSWIIVSAIARPLPTPSPTTVIVQPPPPPPPIRRTSEKCFLFWCERREEG